MTCPASIAHARPGRLGRTFQAAKPLPRADGARDGQLALEARGRTSFWGSFASSRRRRSPRSATKRAEAAELIDFLGLGRYADRFIAELSTGTPPNRRADVDARGAAPRRVSRRADAGVAQREAEAFGPLINGSSASFDATFVVVEHDSPAHHVDQRPDLLLEAGAIIGARRARTVRSDPLVVASYLGTGRTAAIQRSNADANPPSCSPGSGCSSCRRRFWTGVHVASSRPRPRRSVVRDRARSVVGVVLTLVDGRVDRRRVVDGTKSFHGAHPVGVVEIRADAVSRSSRRRSSRRMRLRPRCRCSFCLPFGALITTFGEGTFTAVAFSQMSRQYAKCGVLVLLEPGLPSR